MRPHTLALMYSLTLAGLSMSAAAAHAGDEAPPCQMRTPLQRALEYPSVLTQGDQRVTFRLCAPAATEVKLSSNELDGVPDGYDGQPAGLAMAKDALGYWSVTTLRAIVPGTYRYAFQVNGVDMADPQGRQFSQTARGVRSVFEQPGESAAFHHWQDGIAHGVVSTVHYASASLGIMRRAHVYTPPGYEGDTPQRYPVLYLVHGAGDSDESWTSIGQAQHILDGLIAAGKAKPMIVVMPFGHTPDRPGVDRLNNTDFGQDLHQDLVPYIDRHFRTLPAPRTRAMAGLSMGGAHTLNFGLPYPEVFGAIGVFSVGVSAGDASAAYTARHSAGLSRRAAAKELVFFAFGKDDFLYAMSAPTRQMLDQQHIAYTYRESAGGHTWVNWRAYLLAFAPLLFR